MNSTRIITITTRTSVLRTLNLHNGAKLFLSLFRVLLALVLLNAWSILLCEHAFTHTHTHTQTRTNTRAHNAMRADGSNVFFFQANGWRPDKHTSLATSRNMIGGVVAHFIQSMVLIMFIFNADDSRVKICSRSVRKQPSFPHTYIKKSRLVSVYWFKSHHEKIPMEQMRQYEIFSKKKHAEILPAILS